MFDMIGRPFFDALACAAERHLGALDPCTVALRRAAESADSETVQAAQVQLAAVNDATRDAILAAAHAAFAFGRSAAESGTPPDRTQFH